MTVWTRQHTYSNRRHILCIAGLTILIVAIITTVLLAMVAKVDATTSNNYTLGFQGKLLDTSGNTVPDGFYNIQFKIYQGGSGEKTSNPDGELVWTESYVNNGKSAGVEIKNGVLSVNLGSNTPFGDQIDWSDDTIWLSMNVGGTAENCTKFGSNTCAGDGEMLPMKRMTATPYAMNSATVDGKSASDFVQMAQGTQVDSSDQTSIAINKTGSGDFVNLQNASGDVLTIDNSGNISLGSKNDHQITVEMSDGDTNGGQLSIVAGSGGATSNASGGNLVLQGGSGSGDGADGLVVMNTPTVETTLDDEFCYTGGQNVADSCTISITSVNSTSGIMVGFSEPDMIASLPDPTNTTAGRLLYIMASSDSEQFTLSMNDDSKHLSVKANSTVSLVWNGTDWTTTSLDSESDTAPTATATTTGEQETPLGTMYYDAELDEIQCFEDEGWGDCSNKPDVYISLSPAYSNAVVNEAGIGNFVTGFCSDTLGIDNAGTACSNNETHNYYSWTSDEVTAQTRNIYVSYKLPSDFDNFVSGSLSLVAKTDSDNSAVSYQAYRNSSEGLVACGVETVVSSGSQDSWQTGVSTGDNDLSNCGFQPDDNIVIQINLTASNGAKAYVSDLGFTYSNK